jgi:hypothetical protein
MHTAAEHEDRPIAAEVCEACDASELVYIPPPLPRDALMTLQLLAAGYTPAQISALRRVPVVDVLLDASQAVRKLGAGTLRQAIDAAHRRGLVA